MFEQVKQEIDDKIKTNGNNEITAARLNGVLQDMMDASAEVIEEVQQSIDDQVEANPTGEATEILGTLKIGEIIYEIPEGGMDIFDSDIQATDAERLQALANVSNQTASNPFDGKMGYKVLKSYDAEDADTDFSAQVTQPNTIYEVRDVFDLGSSTFTMPANSILYFNGGKLSSIDAINGNGVKLEGNVSLDCAIKNVKADAIKLSWFSSDENIDNINNAIASASYCDCKVVDGCNMKIGIDETIQVGSINKVSLINLIIDYTATHDNDNLFIFDAGEQQSGYTPTIKDCIFTLTNPTDYENVHCIHLRKWYDTTSSKIDNVLVVGFSGYMFICESYLQEFEFNRFKGNNVGGLISFNKEYGTANAFGDKGAGLSNIIRIINSGIDGKLNHNNTIADLVDLTGVMELYINNVVVQGNIYQVEPTKNAINITKRSTAITTAVVSIFNLWFEWDNKIPVGQTGNGQAADVVFPNGTAMTIGAACNVRFLSGGIGYVKILGQNVYLEVNAGGLLNKDNAFTIAQDAYPTIKLIGTGKTENALMKIKNILDKAYFIFDFIPTGIPASGSATQPQFMFAKSGMIDSLDGIFNNPSINVTSGLFYVDGQLVVRQQPINSANFAYFRYTYVNREKLFPFGNYPKFIHVIYRAAPNVAVTNENKDTFKFIHDHGDLLRNPMNNTYREPLFEVGQSTNIEDAEWKEMIVPFDLVLDTNPQSTNYGYYSIGQFISDGADMTIDIAVSRLYFGDTELIEDVKINPKDKTKLLVIDYTLQNFTNLQRSKMVMTGAPAGYAIYDVSDGKDYVWDGSDWELPFADRILKAATKPSGGFLPNTYYELGMLTGTQSFSLAAATDSTILNQYFWTFETGSTPPTVTWPTGLTWQGGSEPIPAANKHYEISVINNYVVFVEI